MRILSALRGASKNLLRTIVLSPSNLKQCVEAAARALLDGGLVALPTDTVYGLACLADCPKAVSRVYAAKGRSSGKPLAVCLDSADRVSDWTSAQAGHRVTDSLLRALLPGPVTLVLPRGPNLSDLLNPGVAAVGIRVPDHPFIRALCSRVARPVALTSANASGASDSLQPAEFQCLWPHLQLVVDGGLLTPGPPSTVVELMPATMLYRVLRTGRALGPTAEKLAEHGYRLDSDTVELGADSGDCGKVAAAAAVAVA